MRHIPLPKDEHSEAFDACLSNMTDQNSIENLKNSKKYILEAGDIFIEKINAGTLSTILPSPIINGIRLKESMVKLYKDKLSKKGQPGREFYDKWRSISPNNRCPLCSVQRVYTLDHYLSKADFPIYSIFPLNLIPACRDCNTEKLSHIATKYAEETLHPYFDNIDNDRWLYSKVNETIPATFSFYVVASPNWNSEMIHRVNKHMEVFNLHELFTDHAAEELSNIILRLNNLFYIGGAEAVRIHLGECLAGCENANLNSWRSATYRAMYQSTWFHSNGHQL